MELIFNYEIDKERESYIDKIPAVDFNSGRIRRTKGNISEKKEVPYSLRYSS
jgi:hypothetical protein